MQRTELMNLFQRLASEIAEKDFTSLAEDATIASLGVDSLAMLEVLGDMERELNIRVPDDALRGVQTVGQLIEVVYRVKQSS